MTACHSVPVSTPKRRTLRAQARDQGAFQDGGRHAAPSAPDARSRPLQPSPSGSAGDCGKPPALAASLAPGRAPCTGWARRQSSFYPQDEMLVITQISAWGHAPILASSSAITLSSSLVNSGSGRSSGRPAELRALPAAARVAVVVAEDGMFVTRAADLLDHLRPEQWGLVAQRA